MTIKVSKAIIDEVWSEFQMPPPIIEGDVVEVEMNIACGRGDGKGLSRTIVLNRILEKMNDDTESI